MGLNDEAILQDVSKCCTSFIKKIWGMLVLLLLPDLSVSCTGA